MGESIEGRSINMTSFGKGETKLLLWSQMHGDEPTATMALFDLLNFFQSNDFKDFKEELLRKLTIHIIPMLNPDGVERFQRENAIGVDLNRDAIALQCPESQILKAVIDRIKPDFGFNLHDQSKYYNVGGTENPASISFLAPAYNQAKDINEVRGNAMKVIGLLNETLQRYIPNQVAKYDDTFEPRAFGDNIQKWGTSTILIESGGFKNDTEKQTVRRLNFICILKAFEVIASKTYQSEGYDKYEAIPFNERQLVDLKLTNLKLEHKGRSFQLDIGINHEELNSTNGFHYKSVVQELGDLSTYYGYEEFDASGLDYVKGQVASETYTFSQLRKLNFKALLQGGVTHIRVPSWPHGERLNRYPIIILANEREIPEATIDKSTSFLLSRDGKVLYAVINGFLIDLSNKEAQIPNGLVL